MYEKEIKDFIEYTEKNPIPFYVQDHYGEAGKHSKHWSSDMWTLEVARCLLLGATEYKRAERSKELWGNEYFVQDHIVDTAKCKISTMNELKKVKDTTDILLVCEVGRGLDILMASFIRDWLKAICYDYVGLHGPLINGYFGDKMEIDFKEESSEKFRFDLIDEDVILIANQTKIPDDGGIAIRENKHIIHVIRNGRLLYGRDGG